MLYNLLNKSDIDVTGNTSLTGSDIESLHNYITTSGIITLQNSDILTLEVDLGDRHPIDNIDIYSTATTNSGITIEYKETATDSYSSLPVVSSGTSATLPSLFNPRYIKTTFSGLFIDLYELAILSNLYNVSFGVDGKQSILDLGDLDKTYTSTTVTELPVYNNSKIKKRVYLSVNYASDYVHEDLSIGTSLSGTFYNSYSPLFITSDFLNNCYIDSALKIDNSGITLKPPEEADYFVWDRNALEGPHFFFDNSDNWARNYSTSIFKTVSSKVAMSTGKWYFELVYHGSTDTYVGFATLDADIDSNAIGFDQYGWSISWETGELYHNNTHTPFYGGPLVSTSRLGMALDLDTGELWLSRNGVWIGGNHPATSSGAAFTNVSGTVYLMCSTFNGARLDIYMDPSDLVYNDSTFHPDYNLSNYSLTGNYISPLIDLSGINNSSYLDIFSANDSEASVSFYVRSSDTRPMPYYEIYTLVTPGYLFQCDVTSSYINNTYKYDYGTPHLENFVINKKGYIYLFTAGVVKKASRQNEELYSINLSAYCDYKAELSGDDTTSWIYDRDSGTLKALRLGSDGSEVLYTLTSPYNDLTDFINDFSTNKAYGSSDMWYLDAKIGTLKCIDVDGNEFLKFNLDYPVGLTAGENTCWLVADNYNYQEWYAIKVGTDFSVTPHVFLDVPSVNNMCYDYSTGGFFFSSGTSLYSFDGEITRKIGVYFTIDYMEYIQEEGHLVISSTHSKMVKIVKVITGEIIYSFDIYSSWIDSENYTTTPKVFYRSIEHGELPKENDPVWGVTKNATSWYSIESKGDYLKKRKYHQLKFKFDTNNYHSTAKVYKVNKGNVFSIDVEKESYNSFYVKYIDIANDAYSDYEAMLTLHWEDINE